tara:strand:- start:71 stop:493 length:423 start_codon:yes stop_codon:yes gene_type:complete
MKIETVEIQITGGSAVLDWTFPQNENLRGRQIFGMSSWSAFYLATSPQGVANLAQGEIVDPYVHLITLSGNGQSYNYITAPMFAFLSGNATAANSQNNFAAPYFKMSGEVIVWEKSYIRFPLVAGVPAANAAAIFSIHYK